MMMTKHLIDKAIATSGQVRPSDNPSTKQVQHQQAPHPPPHSAQTSPSRTSITTTLAPLAMGNLCGKEATPDPSAENARPLPANASPRPNPSSSVPRRVGGPGRTLGAAAPPPQDQADARKRAAEAAEVREHQFLRRVLTCGPV